MTLWFSGLVLVVGLFLSGSALTPEECQPLITPLSLANHSMFTGVSNFIVGYVTADIFYDILKITQSSRVNIIQSESSPDDIIMTQENRINGTCTASTVTGTIAGDTGTASLINTTSVFQLLPSCDGCLLFRLNTTSTNTPKFLELFKIGTMEAEPEVQSRALYLMAKGTTIEDSDLEQFKKQAQCLGFTGEPAYHYNPTNGFCNEGEAVELF